MNSSRIISQTAGPARQLFLLFHGVGATPEDLVPLGRALAARFPEAWVVSVAAPLASEFGAGYQWFSVRGITEENRLARIAAARPLFIDAVHAWQQKAGLDAKDVSLIGFSQGGIMALEAGHGQEMLAGRIVAIGARFARLPEKAQAGTRIHLIHGLSDPVMPSPLASRAAEHLAGLGAEISVDLLPGVGHEINAAVAERLLERLQA
jgi:phospholipase/carboxylesterase